MNTKILTALFSIIAWNTPCFAANKQPENTNMQKCSNFEIRGVLPWHNFLCGPSAWNEQDYEMYLDNCQAQGINFIGFHNYTGGGERYITYVEPGDALIAFSRKKVLQIAAALEKQGIKDSLKNRHLIIYSKNIGRAELLNKFPPETTLCSDWNEVINVLSTLLESTSKRIVVFPVAPIQIPHKR